MSESDLSKEEPPTVSTHLFPTYMTYRYEHHNPESFLAVAGTILTVLVILIALAAAVTCTSTHTQIGYVDLHTS